MDYQSSVNYLLSLGRELAAPTQAAAAKFHLENIATLDARLGHPSRAYPSAHIAGTNGKGSTAAFLESILRNAGMRTGLNTSPHLERINERIRIGGEEISDQEFADVFTHIHQVVEQLLAEGTLRAHPTYFECVTAMAFEYFARKRVDFAVFEVGLGGRLDATNILLPRVTVITRIGFDHENFLGHSIEEIAAEKAGILKPGVPVMVAPQLPQARNTILQRAQALGCPVIETGEAFVIQESSAITPPPKAEPATNEPSAGRLRATVQERSTGWTLEMAPALPGRFQLQNALNAVAAARYLATQGFPISDKSISTGIAEASWPGRLEKLCSSPDLYLDGAHNPSAAQELALFLKENFAGRKIWLIYGALRDKAVDEVAGWLFPLASEVLLTEPRTPRAISASQLADITSYLANKWQLFTDAESALDHALSRAAADDAIFVAGSLYLVGQLRSYWNRRARVAVGSKTP